MTAEAEVIMEEYLRRLEQELAAVSAADRAEIVLEVREHFDEARRELHDPSEAALRNILERLGPPAAIAAESGRSARQVHSRRFGALEIAALLGWFFWWPVGVLLTSISPRWPADVKWRAMAIQVAVLVLVVVVPGVLNLLASGHFLVAHLQILLAPIPWGVFSAGYLAWKLSRA